MKIWQWAVLLLVLCNMALLLTIWLKPHAGGPPRGESPRDFVVRSLKFSDAQTRQYDVLVKEHQEAMRKLRREAAEYRQALFTNLGKDNGGGINADSIANLIAHNQEQVEMVTYRHFGQVRDLCTEEQKKEFDNIIGDVLKRMNGGPHGGPPPPRDGQDHPDGPPPGDRPGPPPPDGPENH